jgi:O-antigen/teichoic acid export membrane protein
MQADPPEDPQRADPRSRVPGRVYKGTAWQVLGRLLGSLSTFASVLVLARCLSPEEFGRFTFYLAVFGLLDAWTDFGTGSVAVRRTADDRWAMLPVLRSARRVRLGLALVGLLSTALLVRWQGEPHGLLIVAAALYPATHAFELSATVFKNRIDWRWPVAVRSVAALARLLVILAMAFSGVGQAAAYLLASAAVSGAANLALHLVARPHLPKPTIALRSAEGIFREAWPLGLGMVCQQGYFYLDNLFVRAWLGEGPLGHYNAAMRLLSAAIILALYAASSALPWLSERARAGQLAEAAANLTQPLFAAAALFCGLCAPWSRELLTLCFGAPFAAAGPALAWLFAAIAAIHAGAVLLNALVAAGNGRAVLWISLAALGLNAGLNALWVPGQGLVGAAAATAATELFVALGAGLWLGRAGRSPFAVRPWLWILAPLAYGAAFALSAALRRGLQA